MSVVWVVAGVGLKSWNVELLSVWRLGNCCPGKEEQAADSGSCQQSKVYSGCCTSAVAFPHNSAEQKYVT